MKLPTFSTTPEMEAFLTTLPPFKPHKLYNLSCLYGADEVAANYAGLIHSPGPPRGQWHHGWIPSYWNLHPEMVLGGEGSYDDRKGRIYWVAREDQAEFLRERGYRRTKAIGLPFAYIQKTPPKRIPNSLLVMPYHSSPHCNLNNDEDNYLDCILSLRDKFENIVVCIHPSCIENGYWINSCAKRGIRVVVGADHQDENALWRIYHLLSGFDCLVTNGFGSQLAYGAFCGVRVCIYGPLLQLNRENIMEENLYRNCPWIIEDSLRVSTNEEIETQYPFLFCEPHQAQQNRQWGAEEIGYAKRLRPQQVIQSFAWQKGIAPLRLFQWRLRNKIKTWLC